MKKTLLLLFLLLVPVAVGAQTQTPFKDRYRKIEYMIPMRDGVKLYTAVYVPRDKPGKHPILMERTGYGAGPYGPDTYRGTRGSMKMQEAGYCFAWQDVRGRGKSEGNFVNDRPQLILHLKPNDIDESTDTYDTVDFLVKTVPDNNGRVGLWGISYPGFYAGVGAINSHPALKAASPQAPVTGWFIGDDFHHHGAFFLMDAVGFARFGETPENAAANPRPRLNVEGDPVKFYLQNGTLDALTQKYFANTDGLWSDLMQHGTFDEYWQSRSLAENMKNVKCAVMTVGGWFDAEDCWGALHTYAGTEKLNPKTQNSIVMGPWFHGMWSFKGGKTFGAMDWGSATGDYFQEEIEFPFFDNYLRGDGKRKIPEAQVFQTGANQWRTFPTWPPKAAQETSFYLQNGGELALGSASVPRAEARQERRATSYDEYVSDPADPVPYQGGTIRSRTREYMIDDQRFATARKDVLSYKSEPLKQPLTVAGPIQADLFVSMTGTDADFVVKVIDVYPDDAPGKLAGFQMLVRGEIIRGKFRNSYQNPQPFTPGTVEKVSYELPDILHTFQPGHRLMVQVQSSWFPLVDRNPQKFVDIYHAKAEDFQKSTIRIYHEPEHASRIRVGVLR
jgi:putative CocE/NonD family hydrolase